MALPTKEQYQKFLDTLAAQSQAARTGIVAAAQTPANGDLYSQVDAIGNASIEVALGAAAQVHDEALRAPDAVVQNTLAARFAPFLQSLQSQVQSDGTLTPATLDNALTEVGAQVSPLIGLLAASNQSGIGPLSPANVFSPAITSRAFDAVYTGADGALVDETEDAADVGTADVALFAADNHALYLGFDEKPTEDTLHLALALSTLASADIGLATEYWDGTAWQTASTQDAATTGTYAHAGTKGFTQSGVLVLDRPARWDRTNLNPAGNLILAADKTPRYYLRLSRTADALVTPPVASVLRSGIGLGLVLIQSDASAVFVAGAGVDATLYDAPNKLKLRALTAIAQDVTATVEYTNRDETTGRSAAQAAWAAPAAGEVFPAADAYLALQVASEGVLAVSDVSIATTAVAGVFIVESVVEREIAK